jgi:hypothetical protein
MTNMDWKPLNPIERETDAVYGYSIYPTEAEALEDALLVCSETGNCCAYFNANSSKTNRTILITYKDILTGAV